MEYGLTEFLAKKEAPVQIAFTAATADLLAWLDAGAPVDAMPAAG